MPRSGSTPGEVECANKKSREEGEELCKKTRRAGKGREKHGQ